MALFLTIIAFEILIRVTDKNGRRMWFVAGLFLLLAVLYRYLFPVLLPWSLDAVPFFLLFFMTGVAAIDLTMSSMMTVPVAMSAVILPNLVRKKRWGQSRLYLLAVLPCVLVLGVYLLGVRGILQIPVVR